jgi:peptidoglycan-associated lipoprotein
MRRGTVRGLWTVGTLAALGLAAMACSTTNSNPTETQEPADAGDGLAQGTGPDVTELGAVYFELDSAVLPEDGRAALARDAQRIRSNPDWGTVMIEGHCDERGSEEYNLALGERRADAVARYLSDLGVPQERLTTRSFGEMQPAAPGHDELAWRANRRAQLAIAD